MDSDLLLIKEYFMECLREVFKYPFELYNRGEDTFPGSFPCGTDCEVTISLPWRKADCEVIIHLQDTGYLSIISFPKIGRVNIAFKSGRSYSSDRDRDFFYDIHSEESTETVCHEIISCAQDFFFLANYGQ